MRWLVKTLVAITVVFILLVSVAFWGSHNESASQWLLNRTLGMVAEQHKLNGLQGTLADGFRVNNATLSLKSGDSLKIENLSTRWAFSLANKTLTIEELAAQRITFTSTPSPADTENQKKLEMTGFSSPLTVITNKLLIQELVLVSNNRNTLLSQIAAEFELNNTNLDITSFSLQSGHTTVATQGQVGTQSPFTSNLETTLSDTSLQLDASINLNGSSNNYQLDGTARSQTGRLPAAVVELSANGKTNSLSIDSLSFNSDVGNGTIAGKLGWAQSLTSDLNVQAQQLDLSWLNSDLDGLLDLSGEITIIDEQHQANLAVTGELRQLPVALDINAKGNRSETNLSQSRLTVAGNSIDFDGVVGWENQTTAVINVLAQNLDPQKLNANLEGNLNLDGTFELVDTSYSSRLQVAGALNQNPIDAAITFNGKEKQIEDLRTTISSKQSTIILTGNANLEAPVASDLALNITTLNPALFDQRLSGSVDGAGLLTINGESAVIDLALNGILQELPFSVDLDLAAKNRNLHINQAVIRSDSGELTISGTADLNEKMDVNIAVQGSDFNPGIFLPDYPGKLSIDGKLLAIDGQFTSQATINGKLRSYPLLARINTSGTSERIIFEPSSMSMGDNALQVTGSIDKRGIQQLEWKIDAPQLQIIAPELSGLLSGQGTLDGEWHNIKGSSSLKGSELSLRNFSIQDLKLEFGPDNKNQHAIKIVALQPEVGQLGFDSIELDAIGTHEQQTLTFILANQGGEKLSSTLELAKSGPGYDVDIFDTSISGADWGTLQQDSSSNLSIIDASFDLDDFCLQGETDSVCVQAYQERSAFESEISLTNFPLKRLAGWYGAVEQLDDILTGKLSVSKKESNWHLDSQISLDDGSSLDAYIDLMGESRTIQGNIDGNFNSIQWLGLLNKELLEAKGLLNIEVAVNGTVEQPKFLGAVKLIDASTNIPSLGITVSKLGLSSKADQTGEAPFTAQATVGEGQVDVTGIIYYRPLQEWRLEIDVAGDQALLADIPEYRVIASPKLKITVSPQKIDIDGEIDVDQAQITLSESSAKAISVSEDSRIINQDSNEIIIAKKTPIRADLEVKLGDDISLNGKGFEVKLGGNLKISESAEHITNANGIIYLSDGFYAAYGQKLNLKDGTLQFNGPISDPGVNLRAERQIKDQTVGVRVGGSLKSLKSEIYSDPALSQSDAISYLITGKPINAVGRSENTSVLTALTNLGVSGSASIIDDIRASTGLNTLELEGGDDISETALLIGKYLSPQLYVQYIKRLFSENDSLQMRYEFSDKLQLEAETGTQQGIDLIYQLER